MSDTISRQAVEERALIDFYPGTEIFELRPRQWVNGKGWVYVENFEQTGTTGR